MVDTKPTGGQLCATFQEFKEATFVCECCGAVVFPAVTVNEDGIFIENTRTEIRGGKGNPSIKKRVCEDCVRNMTYVMKG